MQYNSLRLYIPAPNVIFPMKLKDGRNISLTFLSENSNFLNTVNFIPTRRNTMRHIFVPTIIRPVVSRLTQDYKKELMNKGFFPRYGKSGEYKSVKNTNFILDYSKYISSIEKRYRIKKYNVGRPLFLMNNLMNSMKQIPSNEYERVLFYSISLDEYIPSKFKFRKIYPIYIMLAAHERGTIEELPFDKILLHVFDHSSQGRIVLLYDKDKKTNISRIKSLLKRIRSATVQDELIKDMELTAEDTVDKVSQSIPPGKEEDVANAITNYMQIDDNLSSAQASEEEVEPSKLALNSILYHTIGDEYKAKVMVNQISSNGEQAIKIAINKNTSYILPKEKASNSSTDPVIKLAKPQDLIDNQVPRHILKKRKTDFEENLSNDLVEAFKVLERKPSPLKVKSIDVKTISSPPSELRETIKDRYTITLIDEKGKLNKTHIDLPHLTENGTFLVNGQEKVLVNQVVTYPIFFFKPYTGKFISSYSAIQIHSKILSKTSYLMAFMASYKFPLILYLAYKQGFDKTLSQYGVTYTITENKEDGSIRLSDKKYINFKWDEEVGRQLVESFRYSVPSFPKENFDVTLKESWKATLENYTGNRNCIYLLDQVWENVVTPIEIRILESRSDPTNISDIIRYISGEVVNGRVDDRNDMGKQRIRTSEIFTALVQKQIYAAYNEYEAKKQAGDPTAELYINSTKTFSEVINSQNVQTLENINPLEELSVMTRITPIGIGGLPDKAAYPLEAMMNHDSYYGNVDPLETPAGPGIGMQQQLTVGASITNVRGMLQVKDRDKIKPSELLSTGPAMIPFVESNDGCRVMMAAGQSKQAVPLQNTEMPMIQTGYESVLTNLLSDNFIKKSTVNGVVTNVDDLLITIKDIDTGKDVYVDTRPITLKSGQGKNGLSSFKHIVKVGDKVKKGQVLSEGANIKDGIITNGINVLCAFMPWKGYNFEDGMVVSESLAKKFVSLHVEEEKVYLTEDDDVSYIGKIGDELKKGDILITYSSTLYDVESLRHLRTDGGKIVNIELFSNLPVDAIPEILLPIYEDTKNKYIALKGKYSIGSFKEKGEKFDGIMIKFTVQQSLTLTKGDKINNRSFNKGVIAIIEKDEDMPQTPWGEPIQLIYNPLSVINRMNTGQLCEMHTSMISKKFAELIEKLTRDKFLEKFQTIITVLDGTDGKQFSRNVIKGMKAWSDKQFSIYRSKAIKDGFIPLMFPPFKSPPREDILKAMKMIGVKPRYPLKIPEYNIVTEPVSVGYIYVMKLEHMSEKKIYARGVGPYLSRTLSPTAGRRSSGGQKMGEYDNYSLLSWNCPIVIDEFFGPLSSDHVTKNEMISEVIQNGTTNYKVAKTNPVKDLFGNMMLAIHLTAE